MSMPKNKNEYRMELANEFASILDEHGLEWKKQWHGVGMSTPTNAITGSKYNGCNRFHLALVSMSRGLTDSRWATMVQIIDAKGTYHPKQKWHLKKGSKASYVEYWYPYDMKNRKVLTWEQYKLELKNGRKDSEFVLGTKYTPVFSAQDIEGIPKLEIQENQDISIDELISKLCKGMSIEIISDGGDQAYYSPATDKIHLPVPEAFSSTYDYNSTALHELSHATGHPTRLNRDIGGIFGGEKYAYEELVAEMSSCFMSNNLITEPSSEHIDNHKAYVQSWIKAIKEKPDTLIRAIKDAQSVANYMDWKSGMITDKEYSHGLGEVMEVKQPKKHELVR